jgi:hypothetical protein
MAMIQPPSGVVYPASSEKTGKKIVRFSTQVVCVGSLSHDDQNSDPANDCYEVPNEDKKMISSLWFTKDELRRIRRRTGKQADRIEGMQNDDDIQTRLLVRNTIGLETNRDRTQRKKIVRKAILSVLLAQEQMWNENKPQDPELLGQLYAEYARISSQKAKFIGNDCAVQVQRYYRSYADDYLYEEKGRCGCPAFLVNESRKWTSASAPLLSFSAECCGAPTLPQRTRSY